MLIDISIADYFIERNVNDIVSGGKLRKQRSVLTVHVMDVKIYVLEVSVIMKVFLCTPVV